MRISVSSFYIIYVIIYIACLPSANFCHDFVFLCKLSGGFPFSSIQPGGFRHFWPVSMLTSWLSVLVNYFSVEFQFLVLDYFFLIQGSVWILSFLVSSQRLLVECFRSRVKSPFQSSVSAAVCSRVLPHREWCGRSVWTPNAGTRVSLYFTLTFNVTPCVGA